MRQRTRRPATEMSHCFRIASDVDFLTKVLQQSACIGRSRLVSFSELRLCGGQLCTMYPTGSRLGDFARIIVSGRHSSPLDSKLSCVVDPKHEATLKHLRKAPFSGRHCVCTSSISQCLSSVPGSRELFAGEFAPFCAALRRYSMASAMTSSPRVQIRC